MRTKIAENNATLEAARESYRAWRELKKEEEKRLFEAVSLFVERADNPVSVDN